MIDVRIVRDSPEKIVLPEHTSVTWPVQSQCYDRGPVRLSIEVPHKSAFGSPYIIALLLLLIIAFWAPAFWLVETTPGRVFLFSAGLCAALFPWVVRRAYPREVLVVDSRFVTLSLGDVRLAVCSRDEFKDVRLTPRPKSSAGLRSFDRGRWPKIVWGESGATLDAPWKYGFGAGVSEQAAQVLLERITEFGQQVPAEEGFEFSRRM